MATTFKSFTTNDIATTRTLLHEAIPMTGTILSGTYIDNVGDETETNIKNYAHGMFQSVYDYPYLSSSANHILDITVGYHSASAADADLSASAKETGQQNQKKINIYNQMAQVLVGHDETGSILKFDISGSTTTSESDTSTKLQSAYFFNFSRLLVKDEIKKGSFTMTFMTGGAYTAPGLVDGDLTLTDSGSVNSYYVNSPAGEYSPLYDDSGNALGLLYYQAGVAVLTASMFMSGTRTDGGTGGNASAGRGGTTAFGTGSSTTATADEIGAKPDGSSIVCLQEETIEQNALNLRNRIKNIQFNNTTELNSTIYFCRVNHNEFNYSSNPTYMTGSKIRVKTSTLDQPVSYITTVGLYAPDNELLAVAKLSEPLRKDPSTELTLRVRLDY